MCVMSSATTANAVEQRLPPSAHRSSHAQHAPPFDHQSAVTSCVPAHEDVLALHAARIAQRSDTSTLLAVGQTHGCPQVFTDASSSAVRIRSGGNDSQQCLSWQALCYANATTNVVLNVRMQFATESSIPTRQSAAPIFCSRQSMRCRALTSPSSRRRLVGADLGMRTCVTDS